MSLLQSFTLIKEVSSEIFMALLFLKELLKQYL